MEACRIQKAEPTRRIFKIARKQLNAILRAEYWASTRVGLEHSRFCGRALLVVANGIYGEILKQARFRNLTVTT